MQALRPGKQARATSVRQSRQPPAIFMEPMARIRAEHAASARAVATARDYFAGTGGIDSCGVAVRGAALWTIVYA